MPKSAKHKQARAADFKKAKLKLGKGKQLAANATNTSFSSKSIALPNQSLTEQPKDGPTSRRNLTLPELLLQLRHYSSTVKREALQDILQLCKQYPYLVDKFLTTLVTGISHCLQDLSSPVRSLCFDVLELVCRGGHSEEDDRDHQDMALDESKLASVSQGLLFFASAALSSLDEGVRLDSLKIVNLLLDTMPKQMTSGWTGQVDLTSEGTTFGQGVSSDNATAAGGVDIVAGGVGPNVVKALLGMLRIKSQALQAASGSFSSATSSDLSPRARRAVLSTLAKFLEAATIDTPIASTSTSTTPWYLASAFETPRSFDNFLASLELSKRSTGRVAPCHCQIEPFTLVDMNTSTNLTSGSLGIDIRSHRTQHSTSNYQTQSSTTRQPTLLSLLHPTLLSSFLDAAPNAFSPSRSDSMIVESSIDHLAGGQDLHLVVAVVRVAKHLYWSELGSSSSQSTIDDLDDDVAKTKRTNGGKDKEREQARKSLVTLLSHAAAYFPFGQDDDILTERSVEEETLLTDLNMTFSSLVSLLAFDVEPTTTRQSSTTSKTKQRKLDETSLKVRVMIDNVREWTDEVLRGKITSKKHPLGLALTPSAYIALEPTLWSLLNQSSNSTRLSIQETDQRTKTLWSTIIDHFVKSNSTSEVKKIAFKFISTIIVTTFDQSYINKFNTFGTQVETDTIKFISNLSKYVWELGTKHEQTTLNVFMFFSKLFKTRSVQNEENKLNQKFMQTLMTTLCPFFSFDHPKRGMVRGPFEKLSLSVQVEALGTLYWLLSLETEVDDELAAAKLALIDSVDRVVESESRTNKIDESVKRQWTVVKSVMSS
ncbi:rRNA processing protein [Microbotryomycetes sp. JL221]|nr:rRNA processing protein [Microbotryomycetes sp. JL221]